MNILEKSIEKGNLKNYSILPLWLPMYYTVLILQSCRYPQEVKKVQAVQKVRKCKRNAFFEQLLSHGQMFRVLICCSLKWKSY